MTALDRKNLRRRRKHMHIAVVFTPREFDQLIKAEAKRIARRADRNRRVAKHLEITRRQS